MTVRTVIRLHFGKPRRYFEDPTMQALYENVSGRKLVTMDTLEFLKRAGVDVEEATQ